jgi:hypothetical protein
VAQVEVDEVLGFVGDEGAKIASYDAVPGWPFALVELYEVLLARCFVGYGSGVNWVCIQSS